ncbi:MAG: hydantoinase B/oxoprolinase family protein, partial [Alphaproteobacteria bacterium]|nr:hydantoinase B/oxoprolinase family protein [Alphaproteobacteria bacterium]
SPFQVTRREIRRGSGGTGKRRGGDGIAFEMTLRGDEPATASVIMNRTRSEAPGLNGGENGALALLQVNGETVDSADHQPLRPGDTLLIASGGGGGFGEG